MKTVIKTEKRSGFTNVNLVGRIDSSNYTGVFDDINSRTVDGNSKLLVDAEKITYLIARA